MSQSENQYTREKVAKLWGYLASLSRSLRMLRIIGYGFLTFALMDTIALFSAPDFGNPVWELDKVGSLVESVSIPLLGLALVFLGERSDRFSWERFVLIGLSRSCLIVCCLYTLLILLGVSSAVRVDKQNSKQFKFYVEQSSAQIQTVQQQLKSITSDQEMEQFLRRIEQSASPTLRGDEGLQEIKQVIGSNLTRGEELLKTQSSDSFYQQRIQLFVKTTKWMLGSGLSIFLFGVLWKSSAWARR